MPLRLRSAPPWALGPLLAAALLTGCVPMPVVTPKPSFLPIPAAPSANAMDATVVAVVQRVAPTVVKVENIDQGALGSGVLVDSTGFVVTNQHVVAGGQKFRVTLSSGRAFDHVTLVGQDPTDDLALLKIPNAAGLPAATLGDSSALRVGQTVLAIGNPLGFDTTVTSGLVSALDRTVDEGPPNSSGGGGAVIPHAVQISAPINPGNSGGALVSLSAEVIGIPTLAAIDPQFGTVANGIGFAIPSNRVRSVVQQLRENGKVAHTGRGALGVFTSTVDPFSAQLNGLSVDHGAYIAKLAPGGAGGKAGLRAGDVIVEVNGQPVTNESNLRDILQALDPGTKVRVTVVRGSSQVVAEVVLGELPASSG